MLYFHFVIYEQGYLNSLQIAPTNTVSQYRSKQLHKQMAAPHDAISSRDEASAAGVRKSPKNDPFD